MSGCVIPTKGGLFQNSPGDSALHAFLLPEVRSSKSRDQAVGERLKVGVGPRFFFTSPKLDDTSGRFILKGKDGCPCPPPRAAACARTYWAAAAVAAAAPDRPGQQLSSWVLRAGEKTPARLELTVARTWLLWRVGSSTWTTLTRLSALTSPNRGDLRRCSWRRTVRSVSRSPGYTACCRHLLRWVKAEPRRVKPSCELRWVRSTCVKIHRCGDDARTVCLLSRLAHCASESVICESVSLSTLSLTLMSMCKFQLVVDRRSCRWTGGWSTEEANLTSQ